MIVDTPRLWLRPVLPDDAELFVALDADPLVMRFVSDGEPTSRAQIVDWTIPRARAEFAAHGTGIWTLIHKPTAEFAGWVALRRPRHGGRRRELELSYRLPRGMWGRGLATEAARAMVAAAFTAQPAERVFAGAAEENIASRRVLEKIGMRPASARGGSVDEEFEILRHQWRAHLDHVAESEKRRGRHRLPDALHGA
ncbi:GNAT family N-acetyltransferase [Gordonia crocea]|uniref:N-acetyltransferase n=1 Tax=Gordonia crocea TaxID=589162 RepID=A0A7I9UYP9_9ACTN|nr:GNAT family N-acetyltransferase [Gordonia crocea]GED98039.1 N-acetyltransferase [Gordonia crocea]